MTYYERYPPRSLILPEHVVDIWARATCIHSRKEKGDTRQDAHAGAQGLRVPLSRFYLLGKPQEKIHGVQHRENAIFERLPPYQSPRWGHCVRRAALV